MKEIISSPSEPDAESIRSVIRVGDGRGFLVTGKDGSKLVITAGHCLPNMPPCMNFSDLGERTYRRLIGPIGKKRTISAECLFVDPISDLAVLGPPDDQNLFKEYDTYQRFVEPLWPFSIAAIKQVAPSPTLQPNEIGWVLSLTREWQSCGMSHFGGPLWLCDDVKITGGMSGSPILSASGDAIGVIASNRAQALLLHNLPCWMLKPVLQQTIAAARLDADKLRDARAARNAFEAFNRTLVKQSVPARVKSRQSGVRT